MSPRQCVELFHLVFLRALVAKGENKGLFALKGGCNLRFFFDSVRYSEDIDFDVVVVSKNTLKNKIDRLLVSPMVTSPLRTKGIEIVEISTPKQTDTTQRWKAGLTVPGMPSPLRTKIEFSRRDKSEGASFEPISREVLRPYGLTPFLATHYATTAAIAQKVHALADRTTPQVRDLFDLNLLFARPEAMTLRLARAQKAWVPRAIERAVGLSFDEYTSQVVAYLGPGEVEIFSSRSAWVVMQDTVLSHLERLA